MQDIADVKSTPQFLQTRLSQFLFDASWKIKTPVIIMADWIVFALVSQLAFLVRAIDSGLDFTPRNMLLGLLGASISVVALIASGCYRLVTRYISYETVGRFSIPLSIAALLYAAAVVLIGAYGFPRSAILIYWILSIMLFIAWRVAVQKILWILAGSRLQGERRPVAIFGAGAHGIQLLRALKTSGLYRVVAFVDSDTSLHKREIAGHRVFPPDQIDSLIQRHQLAEILFAKPEISRADRGELLRYLERYDIAVKTIPGLSELASGEVSIADIRALRIDQLLSRDMVPPHVDIMAGAIDGRIVMVTGAGGSIGAELVRQIFALKPARLVLFEMSEFNLFQIEREIRSYNADASIEIVAVLGNIRDAPLLARVFGDNKVDVVFHAAAYKHVPLVEANVEQGLRNNVFGTQALVEAAEAGGVKLFVLISTDKAVRPTSVMGQTKRIAEMLLQSQAGQSSRTVYTMVRFGNVLGSSGSVVPLFMEQIQRGGPLTVTHPDVTRFFMTITEAAQLVIHAAGIASGGEVFILDMGEPVKIDTLARTMIRLSGFEVRDAANPGGDIGIVHTGLRAGEKLFEELVIGTDASPTAHPRIMRCVEQFLPRPELLAALARLRQVADRNDPAGIRRILTEVAGLFEENGNPKPLLDAVQRRLQA